MNIKRRRKTHEKFRVLKLMMDAIKFNLCFEADKNISHRIYDLTNDALKLITEIEEEKEIEMKHDEIAFGRKELTPKEIFKLIDEKKVNEEYAIKIIELYGARRQRDNIESLIKQLNEHSGKIEMVTEEINYKVEKMAEDKNGH